MRSICYRTIFTAIGVVSSLCIQAQLRAYFDRDTISITPNHSFTNVLRLRNASAEPVHLQLAIDDSTAGGSWLSLPATIRLQPHEETGIPVKYLASPGVIHQALQSFVVRYTTGTEIIETRFYTLCNEIPRLILQPATPVLFLDPQTRKTTASFTLVNEGLLPLHVKLQLIAFPQSLQIADNPRSITIAAATRSMVTFSLQAPGHRSSYSIVAQCTDDSGHILATTDIHITPLGSSQQSMAGGTQTAAPNAVELSYISMAPYYAYWQLRTHGGTGLADSGILSYKANIEYYDHPHGVMAYDSWLAYTNTHYSVRLGGINDNLDYSINGNGIQASYFADSNNTVELFGLRNSYILYTDVSSQLPGADLIAGRYSYHTKPLKLQVSLLHASDPVYSVYSNLLHAEARWQPNPNHELDMEGGFSSESPLDGSGYHLGFSTGMRYRSQDSRLTLALNNYFSSPYYSGYRRGALQLDDEAGWHTSEKGQLYIRYNKAYNAPKYIPTADSLVLLPFDYNNTTIYETAYRWHNSGGMSLTLHPYEMDQRLYSALASADVSLRSASRRLALDLNYGNKGKFLFVGIDGGLTSSDSLQSPTRHYTSLRVLGNVSDKLWSLSWLVQEHPYYLTDQLQAGTPNAFRLYSVSPGLHIQVINDRLLLTGGYTLSYYSVSHITTQILNGRAEYRLPNQWTANGQLYYTLYHVSGLPYPANQQIRVGLEKHFGSGRARGTIHLKLLLFEDKNANGALDPGEHVAPGVIVRLDGQSTLTDGRGTVVYTDLAKGVHAVAIDNSPEWNLPEPMSIPTLHDQTLEIPLVQSSTVNGHVIIERQQYEHRQTEPEGIRVEARAANGKVFATYTDGQGRFRFYLPRAEYWLSVHTEGAINLGAAEQRIVVGPAGIGSSGPAGIGSSGPAGIGEVEFRLQDRRRKIEVKQF